MLSKIAMYRQISHFRSLSFPPFFRPKISLEISTIDKRRKKDCSAREGFDRILIPQFSDVERRKGGTSSNCQKKRKKSAIKNSPFLSSSFCTCAISFPRFFFWLGEYYNGGFSSIIFKGLLPPFSIFPSPNSEASEIQGGCSFQNISSSHKINLSFALFVAFYAFPFFSLY